MSVDVLVAKSDLQPEDWEYDDNAMSVLVYNVDSVSLTVVVDDEDRVVVSVLRVD